MKPTSMIFLVLSLILIFGGVMTCSVASSMAVSDNVAIYDTEFDSNGDAIYTYSISDSAVNKLILNFSDVDVEIVGNAEKSYIELKNFDVNSYRVMLSSGNLTVDGTVGFFSSLLDMSGGGLQFKGLRYFLLQKPDPSRPKKVTVYLSAQAGLKTLNLSLKKGSAGIRNIHNTLDYSLTLNDAQLEVENVISTSVASMHCTNGDITVISSCFTTLNATVDTGKITLRGNDIMSFQRTNYDLSVEETGHIMYNSGNAGTTYKVTSPAPESNVIIKSKNGIIHVEDGGAPAITPTTP